MEWKKFILVALDRLFRSLYRKHWSSNSALYSLVLALYSKWQNDMANWHRVTWQFEFRNTEHEVKKKHKETARSSETKIYGRLSVQAGYPLNHDKNPRWTLSRVKFIPSLLRFSNKNSPLAALSNFNFLWKEQPTIDHVFSTTQKSARCQF